MLDLIEWIQPTDHNKKDLQFTISEKALLKKNALWEIRIKDEKMSEP